MGLSVLIVDDEVDIASLLAYAFTREGFKVLTAGDGRVALELVEKHKVDLIILDVMLPELAGTEVLKALRSKPATRGIPIILLTARTGEIDRVAGLELGADDYVTKPFSPRELLLRARALLRRLGEPMEGEPSVLRSGPIEIELDNYQVRVEGRSVALTSTEFRLLADLMRARGRVRQRDALLEQVWEYNSEVLSRTIDTHVRRLRQKLGPAAPWIRTVRGVGYRVQDPEGS